MSQDPVQHITETATFLNDVAPPLYLVTHAAPNHARGIMVVVSPFGEEKKAAQRALVEAARIWAQNGWEVWRFDFRGTGDSGGDFGDCDIESWREDLRAVLENARQCVGDGAVQLMGLRFGATLAYLAASEDFALDGLILWEPIVSGATYVRQNRQRSQIRSQITQSNAITPAASTCSDDESSKIADSPFPAFDFDGFWINANLHQQMSEIDLLSAPLPKVKRTQILQISGSPRPKKPLLDLQTRLQENGITTEMENIAVEAFWSAIGLVDTSAVSERTQTWLSASTCTPISTPHKYLQSANQAVFDETPKIIAEPLNFLSGDQRVHGVLYRPESEVKRAVILLHGWSGYRSGPGHLLTETARDLARAGYAAYSFDFRGRGDSEWDVNQASLNSMIRDAVRAVPIILDKTGAEKVTLLGLCSGAEVALGAGLSDARIDSLALWSAPVFSGAFTTSRQLRRSKESARKYLQKLFLPETWAKLFTGRLNFKMIARALSGGRSNEDAGVKDKAPDTSSQMQEFAAFKGRLLFVYASNDPETEPSRNFYREFVERTQMPHRFHEIQGANHNYYSMAWKRELIETTLSWLRNEAP